MINSYGLPYFTNGSFFSSQFAPVTPANCSICGCAVGENGLEPCYCGSGGGFGGPSNETTSCCDCNSTNWIANCGVPGTECGASTCESTCICAAFQCNGPDSFYFPCLNSKSECGTGINWTESTIKVECCGCCVNATFDGEGNVLTCTETGSCNCDLCSPCEILLGICNPVWCPCLDRWIKPTEECPCCEIDPNCQECCCPEDPNCGIWIPNSATCDTSTCEQWSCLQCAKNPTDPLCAKCQQCNGAWIPISENCDTGCVDCPGGCTSQDIENGDCVYCAFTGQYIPLGVLCSPEFVLDCTAFPIFYGCCNKEKLTVCYDFNTSDPIYFSSSSANDVIVVEYGFNGGISGSNTDFSYEKIATLCALPAESQIAVYIKRSGDADFTKVVYEADSNGVFPYTVNSAGEYITWSTSYITNEITSATQAAIAAGDLLRIQRATEGRKLLFSFTEGAKLSATDLNLVLHQLLFLTQEKEFISSNYNYYTNSSPIFSLTTGALSLPVQLDFTGAAPGNALIWNGDKMVVGIADMSIDDLNDVTIASPSIGDTIIWNGSQWVTSSAYGNPAWTITGVSPNELITFNFDVGFTDWVNYIDDSPFDADSVFNGGVGATNIPIPASYPGWLGSVRSTLPNIATSYAIAKHNLDYELVTVGTPLYTAISNLQDQIDDGSTTVGNLYVPVTYTPTGTVSDYATTSASLNFSISNSSFVIGGFIITCNFQEQDNSGTFSAGQKMTIHGVTLGVDGAEDPVRAVIPTGSSLNFQAVDAYVTLSNNGKDASFTVTLNQSNTRPGKFAYTGAGVYDGIIKLMLIPKVVP